MKLVYWLNTKTMKSNYLLHIEKRGLFSLLERESLYVYMHLNPRLYSTVPCWASEIESKKAKVACEILGISS